MKPLQERILEAADRLADNALAILGHARRGERPPEHIVAERDRLVAELLSLKEERGDTGERG